MKNLVSIATPCYNVEGYIDKYLESIINQTYTNIQLILVNDGSTDMTENIIKKYEEKLREKNIELIYIYQKNSGQAAALKNALKHVKGTYFIWPDSDDYFEKDAIEKMANFLDNNKQYSLVRTKMNMIDKYKKTEIFEYGDNKYKENVFEDYILENNVYYCGGIMIRFDDFKKVNPNLEMYCNRGGQNWQILLPILYNNKCGYLDIVTYNYVIRDDSHSHSVKTKEDTIKSFKLHEDVLLNTLNIINMAYEERTKYEKMIKIKYIRKKLIYAAEIIDKDLSEESYLELKKYNLDTKEDKILYLKSKNIIFNITIRIFFKIKRILGGNLL